MKAIRIKNPKALVFMGDKNTDEVMRFFLNCEHGAVKITFQSYAYLDGYGAVPVTLNAPENDFALCFNEVVVEAVKRATLDENLKHGDFIDLKGGAMAADDLKAHNIPAEPFKGELTYVDINGVED